MTVKELLISNRVPMRHIDFIAIVSEIGVVLNSAEQQPVWFGMHQLSEDFMDKEVSSFAVAACDDVFSGWENGPAKNHTFEDVLISSDYGNELFTAMSLGDEVLFVVLKKPSDLQSIEKQATVHCSK